MTDIEVLQPQKNTFAKIAVFTPTDYAEKVAQSLFNAGAGEIGNYDQCLLQDRWNRLIPLSRRGKPIYRQCWRSKHQRGNAYRGYNPNIQIAKGYRIDESRHPYEEPAFDIIPLLSEDHQHGSGAVGNIQETPLKDLLARLKEIFKVGAIRYCGDDEKPITRIALCGGSGAFLIGDAIGKKCGYIHHR